MSGDLFQESIRLGGALTEEAYDHLCSRLGRLGADGERYRLADDAQDPELVIRRESDGQYFELDVAVTVRRVMPS